ncbi:DNA binding methylated-DNA--cysteine S-methyltransferase [Setomelanomma holmii]|uniref:Methylated-DNA--protein-cysteine methyltransferase n=1 Tax=Setomelanomma holmii TaxID=210430 RepID=A0A9P4LPI0_9PLEO|nr:DNA binding methylated-DNA--cysteine S-methyltransferase [Setomelanomma holmii]
MSKHQSVTKYQERVYAALQQIPEGRITSYAAMAKALNSSPRAVGGALRVNPFAPEIPCHRCIASTGAPSGQNQESKLKLLKEEGVLLDASGFLVNKSLWWDEFDVAKLK